MTKHLTPISYPRLAFNPDEDIFLDIILFIPVLIWDGFQWIVWYSWTHKVQT